MAVNGEQAMEIAASAARTKKGDGGVQSLHSSVQVHIAQPVPAAAESIMRTVGHSCPMRPVCMCVV